MKIYDNNNSSSNNNVPEYINIWDYAKRNHSHYFKGDIKPKGKYDCIIVTVAHNEFVKMRKDTIMNLIKKDGIIIDIKGIWKKKGFLKKFNYWCL